MARYNHFAPEKYAPVRFADLGIGQKFRNDFFKGKIRRRDIICIKTGELTYIEQRSKKEHTLLYCDTYMVNSHTELLTTHP